MIGQNIDSVAIKNSDLKKHALLTDQVILNFGFFFPSKTLRIQADGAGPNEEVEFNKAFGFDNKETTLAFNLLWRFSKSDKWNLGIEYFGVKNNKTRNIEKEIEWRDVTFPVGVEVNSKSALNLFRVFFGRIISKGSKHELGTGLGIHALDIGTSLEGFAFVNEASTSFERRKVKVIAPLPNIGLWYVLAPTEKLVLSARIDWFVAKIKNYTGALWNLAPGIKYQFFDHLGVGLSYRYFSTRLDVDNKFWHGNVFYDFHGPLVTISSNF